LKKFVVSEWRGLLAGGGGRRWVWVGS